MGTATQRYHYTRDFNWEAVSFHCGGRCIPTTQLSIGSEAFIMAATDGTGQFFPLISVVVMTQGAWVGLAGRQAVTNIPNIPPHAYCIMGIFHIYLVNNEIMLAVPQSRPIIPH